MREQNREYTTNIQKGGALIQESRHFLLEWSPSETLEELTNRVTAENLLGKMSRRRVRDIVTRIFKRRFDEKKTPGVSPARELIQAGVEPEITDRVLFYHAALADDLLYDFVVEFLFQKYAGRGFEVTIDETQKYLTNLERDGNLERAWTPTIRTKVARGLLAACRDFHVLEGRIRKNLAPVSLPMEVFIYVAYYLKGKVGSATRIVEHSDWRLFFLDPSKVEQMFIRAQQDSWLVYHAAGRLVRVDWRHSNIKEAVDAIAQRTHSVA